jgi:hypothetical protein
MDGLICLAIGIFLGVPFGFFLMALMLIAGDDRRDGE